jgi:hypothetical protein
MKKFYRVSNEETQQGLWYTFQGVFTGNIHHKYDFCKHNDLAMDFDDEIVGYLSVAEDLEGLFFWFPKEDILKLQEHGYFIHVFETDDYKFYERFQHYVINQNNSQLVKRIVL